MFNHLIRNHRNKLPNDCILAVMFQTQNNISIFQFNISTSSRYPIMIIKKKEVINCQDVILENIQIIDEIEIQNNLSNSKQQYTIVLDGGVHQLVVHLD